MDLLTILDLDIISALLLTYVLVIAYNRLDKKVKYNQFFLIISALTVVQLILDLITSVIMEHYSKSDYVLMLAMFLILYAAPSFIIYFWAKFVRAWIYQNTIHRKANILLLIPTMVSTAMVLLSPWNGMAFVITKSSLCIRGAYYIPYVCFLSIDLIYSIVFIIKHRRKFQNHESIPLLGFAFVPAATGCLQAACPGLLIIWGSTAISLVVLFIFLQQKMLQIDTLTGTWTKSSFENYITYRADHFNSKTGLLFVDLNQFKMINDTYGHLEGDNALAKAAHLLKNTVGNSGIVARFGGDEFVIMLENFSELKLKKLDGRLHGIFEEYNNKSGKPYQLSISSGYGMYHSSKDIWQFINHVDYLMYQNKRSLSSKL